MVHFEWVDPQQNVAFLRFFFLETDDTRHALNGLKDHEGDVGWDAGNTEPDCLIEVGGGSKSIAVLQAELLSRGI